MLMGLQEGLKVSEAEALIEHLRKREVGGRGPAAWRPHVEGSLMMALLYGLDASLLEDIQSEDG